MFFNRNSNRQFFSHKLFSPAVFTLVAAFAISLLTGCQPNSTEQTPKSSISNAAAHWLTSDTIVIHNSTAADSFTLITEFKSGKKLNTDLEPKPLTNDLATQFPHLKDFQALQIDDSDRSNNDFAKAAIKGVNTLVQKKDGKVISRSYVQHAALLDNLFTLGKNDADDISSYGAKLGNRTQFTLWAPTATQVYVLLFDANKQPINDPISLSEDTNTGVWAVKTAQAKAGMFYQYQVEVYHPRTEQFERLVVTDPYSLSLSTNSKYSQIVDLSSSELMPKGWTKHSVPTMDAPEDLIIYETHVRDFSAFDTALLDPQARGKFIAFSEQNSDGIKHLKKLKASGLNAIQLLPSYDLSTINEDPNQVIDLMDSLEKVCEQLTVAKQKLPDCDEVDKTFLSADGTSQPQTLYDLLSSLPSDSGRAQEIMEIIRPFDNYNWGYDPFHYTVPEGSYSTNADGTKRIIEFRQMVQSLHELGFRVIMDVVYNHTFASGITEKSVLDKIVPNYYHRYDPISGQIETSTCCDNSATERTMMAKLMTDSLVTWAKDYKVDGFRFDLMGHQPKSVMLKARDAVRKVDRDTYFYGEGWNFGEVANNRQFVQATQTELVGTEIGTFTDRLRDAVRGGNFQTYKEGLRHDQGIGNGLTVVPNDLQNHYLQVEEYLKSMDQIKLGLAGNLKNFKLVNTFGTTLSGSDIPYGGGPAGYAEDPADTINYVSKHDNQTLWDNNQYRLPYDLSTEDRVRFQLLSLSYPLMAQGIPFIHMGSELLRSKSFLRDSYDYGDWFNKVDYTYQTNNYNVGLPPAQKDADNWPIIKQVLSSNNGRDFVRPEHILFTSNVFQDFIKIRSQSPLLKLRTKEQVEAHLTFLNTDMLSQRGLIVMHLSDNTINDLDSKLESMVIIFNSDGKTQTFRSDASEYQLHPVQEEGTDDIVKRSEANETGFTVPPLTTAVFVRLE